MAKKIAVQELNDELFGLVETDQGKSFISDGVSPDWKPEDYFMAVRMALSRTNKVAATMRDFLERHGGLGSCLRVNRRKNSAT